MPAIVPPLVISSGMMKCIDIDESGRDQQREE